jgi:hypothetical protein
MDLAKHARYRQVVSRSSWTSNTSAGAEVPQGPYSRPRRRTIRVRQTSSAQDSPGRLPQRNRSWSSNTSTVDQPVSSMGIGEQSSIQSCKPDSPDESVDNELTWNHHFVPLRNTHAPVRWAVDRRVPRRPRRWPAHRRAASGRTAAVLCACATRLTLTGYRPPTPGIPSRAPASPRTDRQPRRRRPDLGSTPPGTSQQDSGEEVAVAGGLWVVPGP